MKKAIIALSGGIDSAVSAGLAKSKGYELYFLTVNYGQKNIDREIQNSKKLSEYFEAKEHRIIDMSWLGELGKSGITDKKIKSFKDFPEDIVYVPNRNTCILSACIAWAEVIDADYIMTGSEAGPWICPDNSPKYYRTMNLIAKKFIKFNKHLKIVAPLNKLTKTQIIKLGYELKIPFELTWSCVASAEQACGYCNPCKVRMQAFKELNIADPAYKEKKEG